MGAAVSAAGYPTGMTAMNSPSRLTQKPEDVVLDEIEDPQPDGRQTQRGRREEQVFDGRRRALDLHGPEKIEGAGILQLKKVLAVPYEFARVGHGDDQRSRADGPRRHAQQHGRGAGKIGGFPRRQVGQVVLRPAADD